jgi:hypothetical protein
MDEEYPDTYENEDYMYQYDGAEHPEDAEYECQP